MRQPGGRGAKLPVPFKREQERQGQRYHGFVLTSRLITKSLNLRAFPWETYGGDVRLLKSPEWSKGRAIKLTTRREDFMRHEVQGARQFYKKYRKQSLHALTLRPKYRCGV